MPGKKPTRRVQTINTIIKGHHIRAYLNDEDKVVIEIDEKWFATCTPELFSETWGLAKTKAETMPPKKKE